MFRNTIQIISLYCNTIRNIATNMQRGEGGDVIHPFIFGAFKVSQMDVLDGEPRVKIYGENYIEELK